MKKLIGIFLMITLIVLLPACGGSSEEDTSTSDNNAEVSIEQDSDEMKITGEGSETTVTKDLDKSVKLPEGYPEDIMPVYEDLFLITAMKRDDGSFAISGGSKDSIQRVGEFYEEILADAKVMMKDFSEDTYSNIGEFKGSTYTITIAMPEGEMVDRFESVVTIILVPGNLMGMTPEETTEGATVEAGNKDYAGGLVVPDDLILPDNYPEKEIPFYAKGEENVLAAVGERNGQQMVGYMTTDPIAKVYDYFQEKYGDADQFMVMNDTDTDKNIMISMDGKVFQVVLHTNNEMTGEDLKYKTLISIMY